MLLPWKREVITNRTCWGGTKGCSVESIYICSAQHIKCCDPPEAGVTQEMGQVNPEFKAINHIWTKELTVAGPTKFFLGKDS